MKDSPHKTSIQKESQKLSYFLGILIVLAFSGIVPQFLVTKSFSAIHWNTLGHSFVGFCFLLPIIVYTSAHVRRTLGNRQFATVISGVIAVILLFFVWLTGSFITVWGQTERLSWVFDYHAVLGYSVLVLVIAHLFFYRIKKRNQDNGSNKAYITVNPDTYRKVFFSVVVYFLSIILLTFFYDYFYKVETSANQAAVQPYALDYGNHPFRPSQTETLNKDFIKAEVIGNSPKCGTCHQGIFKDWLSSMHSQAASDAAYVKNIHLLSNTRGITATRYCEGCHAPVALLSGQLTPGGKHGGVRNTLANHEGVGCMGCHGISKAVHLDGVGSYEFSPSDTYLFEHSDSVLGQKIHNFLIKVNPTQHKSVMKSEFTRSSEMCSTCHEQFMDKSMNNWGWVKMQNEYSSWLSSGFSGQTENEFKEEKVTSCQDCHFPLVEGSDPSANNDGYIRSHRSPGANTAIPSLNNDKVQLEVTRKFLQSGKVKLHIELPTKANATLGTQFVDEELRNKANNEVYFYLGERVDLRVYVSNRMVGHNFPAGTTDISQAWVYLKVTDAQNTTIYESGTLDENNVLDKKSHIFHTIPVDRHGKEVWKHDLFRMTGDAYKNLIPPGKSDIAKYSFTVPSWAKSPLVITSMLKHRKFNQRYANWVFGNEVGSMPITVMDRDAVSVQVRTQPKALGTDNGL